MHEPSREELLSKIAELEERVAESDERWALNHEIDHLAEVAVRDRLPLDHAMRLVMPALCRAVGATVAWIRTYDETLQLHDFVHAMGEDDALGADPTQIFAAITRGERVRVAGRGCTVVAQPLDVAGEPFGGAAIRIPGTPSERDLNRIAALLDTFCEELDNTLAAVALARKKAIAIDTMADALLHPVLDEGIRRAIEVLETQIEFDDLLLVFRHEDDWSGRSLHYKVARGGKLVLDSREPERAPETDAFLRARAMRFLNGDDAEVRDHFGIQRFREEVLITGMRTAHVVGRMLITPRRGEFATYDRDLLDRFADSLRQRIVDFNKEWKQLAHTFPRESCLRLLREEGYRARWLTPREQPCAVMFCDISGFTRVCEQVLVKPQAIGRLVDTWSARVVELLWETGGAFDKMVGDCVIGIWGPPFFDRSPQESCLAALEAAQRIREFTRALVDHEDLPELRGHEPVDVATGLHWTPLFVGVFGPNEDYTGFSAGMNNTARLQGQAKGGEILCMDAFVAQLEGVMPAGTTFGEWREARVKNVEHPLRFRAAE